ncbi:MAG: hypothetical protein DRQ65_08620, partial [Gammaproteobacteria bacterium]
MRIKTHLLRLTLMCTAVITANAFAADPASKSVGKHHKPLLYDFPGGGVGDPSSGKSHQPLQEFDADVVGEPGRGSGKKNPLNNVYFGEQHLHTSNSPDAFSFG